MSRLQAISDFGNADLRKLLDSIDYVFLDIDGVLLYNKSLIPGSKEAVAHFRKLGKKIVFVSNNTVYPRNVLLDNIKQFGATDYEIITPNDSLLGYLQKIGFKKDIFVISCSLPKQVLKEAGYNVIDYKDICSTELEEHLDTVKELSIKTLEVCKNVGAVLVDHDYNFCYGAAQVCKFVLNHVKDVIFLSGMPDDTGTLNEKMRFIVPKFYIDALERWANRKSTTIAKPGLALKEALHLKYNIEDDSRVLFIGDSVITDITFGVNCGYQTCLVLSGIISQKEAEEWPFPEDVKPTYVAQSLGEIYEKIKDL